MEPTVPILDQKTNDDLNQKIAVEIIALCQRKKRPIKVLIDGKSAAGKSFLAGALKNILEQQNQPACIIEADWFLKDRDFRIGELDRIIKTGKVYADSHLQFWNWEELKRQLDNVYHQATTGGRITLHNLVIRGESNTTKDLIIPQNAVILVPGCYLLSQMIADDLSIMLYVNREEGWRRKMDREYQKNKESVFPEIDAIGTALLCWELLEEPTFLYHMIKHGNKAQIIVDNSGPGPVNIIKYEMTLTKSLDETRIFDPDVARFVFNLSEMGREIFRSIQSGKPGEVIVQENGITLTIAFN
jgi:uridine kinase